ncbi:MAG: hypothetical protein CBB97_25580 [Candidatus Endolissoclinum sp. TMED37]|nr:MAG: hypothetical protein CBB97_25580 [Candidatus Endolissoclinum sp. TMED37]
MIYDKKYWDYQKKIGDKPHHTRYINSKFSSKIRPSDVVLDFGCGGGYVLNSLDCKKKIGIEINPSAKKQATKFGIQIHESLSEVHDNSLDVVISNSALEHIDSPRVVLSEFNRILKKNGKLMISVPHEDLSYAFEINDINQHLFTWSPMSFGNLVQKSGFQINNVTIQKIIQPPFANVIYATFGIIGYKILGNAYRNIRKMLIPLKRVGVTGDIIVYATKI